MAQGLRGGPVIEESLRVCISGDVGSDCPALGPDVSTQPVHLASATAHLHQVPPATLPAAYGEGCLEFLSGLFGRGHGGGGDPGSGASPNRIQAFQRPELGVCRDQGRSQLKGGGPDQSIGRIAVLKQGTP